MGAEGEGKTGSLNLKTAAGTTQGEAQRENRLKAAAVPEGHADVQTTHEYLEAHSERGGRDEDRRQYLMK